MTTIAHTSIVPQVNTNISTTDLLVLLNKHRGEYIEHIVNIHRLMQLKTISNMKVANLCDDNVFAQKIWEYIITKLEEHMKSNSLKLDYKYGSVEHDTNILVVPQEVKEYFNVDELVYAEDILRKILSHSNYTRQTIYVIDLLVDLKHGINISVRE